jgi:hypothetical protein
LTCEYGVLTIKLPQDKSKHKRVDQFGRPCSTKSYPGTLQNLKQKRDYITNRRGREKPVEKITSLPKTIEALIQSNKTTV